PGAKAYRRLHAFLRRNVSGEHQSLPPPPQPPGEFCRLDEGGQGELLRRLQVRALRIRQGRTLVRQPLQELRSLRLRPEYGEERSAGDAASYRLQGRRTDYVADALRCGFIGARLIGLLHPRTTAPLAMR